LAKLKTIPIRCGVYQNKPQLIKQTDDYTYKQLVGVNNNNSSQMQQLRTE